MCVAGSGLKRMIRPKAEPRKTKRITWKDSVWHDRLLDRFLSETRVYTMSMLVLCRYIVTSNMSKFFFSLNIPKIKVILDYKSKLFG